MKLIKLNRRHTAFKENGHKWAFRFEPYDPKSCSKIEEILREMHGSQYRWDSRTTNIWKSGFGHSVRGGPRPYWISFSNESDATVVLLQLNLDQ